MGASVSNPNFSEPEKEPGSAGAVLIADDDPAIRLVLRHRLEADGMRVEEAGDSAAALIALRANRFDVFFFFFFFSCFFCFVVLFSRHARGPRTVVIVFPA